MSILITGGAGFIGSHTAKLLWESGLDVVVLDNLTTGCKESARWGDFVQGDIADTALVRSVLRDYSVSTVLHLAASVHAGESMIHPGAYFLNNVGGSMALLDAMVVEGAQRLVFASSCAVYGDTASLVVSEKSPTDPLSPYGESKLTIERALPFYERAYGLKWVALRYFNVAGAESGICEDISTSVRIIPRALHWAIGDGTQLEVFGTDFPTLDGSAVRDYVHVTDIAAANLKAIQYVASGQSSEVFNIGSGTGVSVLEIIETVCSLTGTTFAFQPRPRRSGDPAYVVSDSNKARELLGWVSHTSKLSEIVSSVHHSYRLASISGQTESNIRAANPFRRSIWL